MKTTKLFLGLASVLAMGLWASCTDDKVDGPSSITDAVIEDGVYMQFKLELPTTRSETTSSTTDGYGTSDAGTEVGQSYENIVSTVNVVLLDANNEAITTATAEPISAGSDTYVVAFESTALDSYLDQNIYVFVYCNPIVEFSTTTFDLDAAYTLTGASDATAWTNNKFLMSNAQLHQSSIPESLSSYKSKATPLDLGIVYVERSMARFDFMDGSANTNNTYDMGNGISITLTDVALINMSSSFYYVRRVSDNGLASGDNFAYCGTEWAANDLTDPDNQTGNYVVDTDATAKATAADYGTSSLVGNFWYPMSTPSTWAWTSISDILSGTPDNYNNGTYNIWRYVTENTIPADVDNQKKGITTGVVFKGLINVSGTGESGNPELRAAMDDGAQIFEYENTLYGSWAMIETLVANTTAGTYYPSDIEQLIIIAYNEVQNLIADDAMTLADAQAQAGFTGYTPEENTTSGGYDYYTYYYYWNRHNDNGFDGVMGIMEFDVVRNNVYKLSVTGINSFGHPTPGGTDPDPDPENPDDPDESDEVYIQVEVQILPWVVRINDITF